MTAGDEKTDAFNLTFVIRGKPSASLQPWYEGQERIKQQKIILSWNFLASVTFCGLISNLQVRFSDPQTEVAFEDMTFVSYVNSSQVKNFHMLENRDVTFWSNESEDD